LTTEAFSTKLLQEENPQKTDTANSLSYSNSEANSNSFSNSKNESGSEEIHPSETLLDFTDSKDGRRVVGAVYTFFGILLTFFGLKYWGCLGWVAATIVGIHFAKEAES